MNDEMFDITPKLPAGVDLPAGIGSLPLPERAVAVREHAAALRQRAATETSYRVAEMLRAFADGWDGTAASPDFDRLTADRVAS